MENSDITAEKVQKLYDYLNEEKNRKIKNIESKISAKEELLTELDDEKVENINQEIEGLKKYKEQIEEELNNVEELKEFSSNLKEIEEEIEQVENEIKEIEKEEKNIDLNNEDAPSNLYDLSERKKELETKKEGLTWERKAKIGIILAGYGKELDEMPENMRYNSASYSLNKRYEAKLQELSQNKYDLENQLNNIVQEFDFSAVDIEDEFSYQDNDELVKLKAEYDKLSEEKEEVEFTIANMENSDILDKIEEIKQVENQIEEIDNELEKIDNQLDEYKEIIENEELSDDSEEKKNAKIKLEKLKKEKSEKITDKNENIGKKDELYKYVNGKINGKAKNKEKSKNAKNINQSEGYWVYPTESQPRVNKNNVINDDIIVNENNKEENVENKSLLVSSGNIISDYSKADNNVKNSLYLSKGFVRLVEDLKSARGLRSISKEQKKLLKNAIENHGELISKELKGLNQKEFTNIVTSIYGNDNSFLNKYMKKDLTTGEDIVRLGLFYDLYEHNENNITKIKSFDKMNSQSIEFIDNLFNKYYEKVKNGEIEKDSDLDIQFKKMIANPIKFGIISSYNKDVQKPFLFRLNKIKSLFSKKSKQSQDILEKVSSNIKSNEISLTKTNGKVDKLGLGDSVVKNPPPIVNQKETPTRNVDAKQL